MDSLFLTILNMSITGAFVIVAICLARLSLKRAPKMISYCLWAVAGFRLVFPFSIESMFSLIPFNNTVIPSEFTTQAVPHINNSIPVIDSAVSSILPAATASTSPLQTLTMIGAYVWLAVSVTMVTYGVVSYIRLKIRMRSATRIEENIYEIDTIKSPFVLGVFKPEIYIPSNLNKQEYDYIILHEQTHIRRRDHINKVAAYIILCVHWFNPLAWVAFLLMSIDMEMSCDECVLKSIGIDTKKKYSLTLLSQASNRNIIGISPLAFSEGGLKTRIRNVLNFKKIPLGIVIIAIVLTIALSVGLTLNRVSTVPGSDNDTPEESIYNFATTKEGLSLDEFLAIRAKYDVVDDFHTGTGLTPSVAYDKIQFELQLAEYIGKFLETDDFIQESILFINIGNDSPFEKPSASVIVNLEGISKLTDEQIVWIADIIKSSVFGIETEDIRISDNYRNYYDVSAIYANISAKQNNSTSLLIMEFNDLPTALITLNTLSENAAGVPVMTSTVRVSGGDGELPRLIKPTTIIRGIHT